MKYLIIILTTCALCMGCKKNRTVIAKGRVINPVTGDGQADFEVRILKNTKGSVGTTGGVEEVVETFTDANGNFEIQYTGGGTYQLSCNLPVNNYPIGWYQNGEKVNTSTVRMSLPKGEETYAEYHSVPYKDVYISTKNINCEGATDEMLGKKKYEYSDTQEYYGHSIPTVGCYDNVGFVNIECGYHYYIYTVNRPSGTYTVYDTIFVDPNKVNDTVYLEY